MKHRQILEKSALLVILLFVFSFICIANEASDVNSAISQAKEPVVKLEQGKEIPFLHEDDELKIFIPPDYNDANPSPIIFSYPGQGGRPSTGYFQAVTEDKGFIIVGMSYKLEPEAPASQGRYMNYLKAEMLRIGKIKMRLEREYKMNIDERKMILGGTSKGGWFTSEAIEYRPQPWAGAVILAAGRMSIADYPGQKYLKDKPIYIGVGETDANRDEAESARKYYRRRGARVTFEMYPGMGHAVKPDDLVLREWLRELVK